jgi:hypothetical protein
MAGGAAAQVLHVGGIVSDTTLAALFVVMTALCMLPAKYCDNVVKAQRARRKRAKAEAAADSKKYAKRGNQQEKNSQQNKAFQPGFLGAPTVGARQQPAQLYILDAMLPALPGEHAPRLSNNLAAMTMLVRTLTLLPPCLPANLAPHPACL